MDIKKIDTILQETAYVRTGGTLEELKCAQYLQGECRKLSRLCKSNQNTGFKYKFDTLGQEPEGLTWWDLDKDYRAPAKERGQLHVILLDNDPGGTDDLVFKHFRRNK